ncbi:hypothetical protein C3747_24g388 [Trypanosoma cruzi]|uniref:RING-type E3 ubiquitin transferase n=2 Tax=Trypanosoma cruzi TaxID=5693 RepID=Q4DPJ5_TRYCC|nr:hypothetical protein, conserved [Trypanosoma cruzi]EAN94449.1 hypothetical protein, conserved [Trypanosoma cruzi]KAF8302144.1 putative Ring finger domain containing protein [Trypanosoma cruzi]PWV16203.1 hypothetical protein C3747_24g388 [Trypanosoma cruzi]RNC50673.1 hypothetical protein TcCL_ESM12273 [Trypanosoma cruzi]|eukprot:XP_816300.1 hypothetical protein [Trypanosoma cruzi strain CL Brener]
MDPPFKETQFAYFPSSDSLSSPAGPLPNSGSFSSYSDTGKAGKSEDTFVVGEYRLSSCPICLERFTLDNPAIVVLCGHGFHLQCLESWRQRASICPVCMKLMQGEGIPMMSARDTRRRRRYKGVNSTVTAAATARSSCDHRSVCMEPAMGDPMMAPPQCTPPLGEEHIANTNRDGGVVWSVLSVLWSLSRWCSRGGE